MDYLYKRFLLPLSVLLLIAACAHLPDEMDRSLEPGLLSPMITRGEVESLLGGALEVVQEEVENEHRAELKDRSIIYRYSGLSVHFLVSGFDGREFLLQLCLESSNWRLPDGIGPGSLLADLQRLYPLNRDQLTAVHADGELLLIREGLEYRYLFDRERIRRIEIRPRAFF